MNETAESHEGLPAEIAIIGLGLMGGSLGLAARDAGIKVAAYARSEESRKLALENGIADSIHATPLEAVKNADIIILCTPILTMPELVREMLPALKDNSIITDVGSTKVFPAHEIGEILRDTSSTFIGSHPLTGSEQSGTKAARPGLYRNATVFVTTTPDTPTPACRRVATFWKHIGSHVIILSASEHDQMMARTSHLPHLAAATLVKTATRDTRNITQFCGPGIRDTTRIAEGPEQVWHDITKTNRDAILQELRAFSENIGNLITMLENNNFEAIKQLLADSRKIRSSWNPKQPSESIAKSGYFKPTSSPRLSETQGSAGSRRDPRY